MQQKGTADLVRDKLGINTYSNDNPVASSVGATAATILRKNPNRLWIVIINLSVNTVYVGTFSDVSASKGIALGASGGSVALEYQYDLELVTREWWGIAPAGASNILVVEQVIQA